MLEERLCRLAKLFQAKHEGSKMEVKIEPDCECPFLTENPMLELGKEATIIITPIVDVEGQEMMEAVEDPSPASGALEDGTIYAPTQPI